MDLARVMDSISFIGMAGSGKTTISKALAKKLDTSFIDTDLLIEERFNQTLEELKKSKGYKFVRLAEERIILSLDNKADIISTGGSAIYSDSSMQHLASFSKIFYISTPLKIIQQRIGMGQERGLAVPEGTSVEDTFNERQPMYEKWTQKTLDGSLTIDDLVDSIIRNL